MLKQNHKKPYPKNRKSRALHPYICVVCGYKSLTGANCKRKYCDKCKSVAHKKIQQDWWFANHKKNLKKQRNNALKHLYGITSKDYENLLESQDYCCAICGRPQSEFKNKLGIDHDHNTKKVRGALCNFCNLGLGWFEANRNEILEYLNEN